jgi:hypothetical protein
MEDVGIFHGHLVYFTAICYILWLFGMFFSRFGMLYQKNLAALEPRRKMTTYVCRSSTLTRHDFFLLKTCMKKLSDSCWSKINLRTSPQFKNSENFLSYRPLYELFKLQINNLYNFKLCTYLYMYDWNNSHEHVNAKISTEARIIKMTIAEGILYRCM